MDGDPGPSPAPQPPPGGLVTMPLVGAVAAFNVVCVAIVFLVLDQQAKKKHAKAASRSRILGIIFGTVSRLRLSIPCGCLLG